MNLTFYLRRCLHSLIIIVIVVIIILILLLLSILLYFLLQAGEGRSLGIIGLWVTSQWVNHQQLLVSMVTGYPPDSWP